MSWNGKSSKKMWCKLWNSNSRQLFDVWQVDTIKYLLVVRRTTTRNTSPLTHGIWPFSWIVITPHTCELAIKWLTIITLWFSSQLFVICCILGRDGSPSTCANLIQVHNQFKLLHNLYFQLIHPEQNWEKDKEERCSPFYSTDDSLVFKWQFSSWRISWAKLGRTLRQCVHISRLPVWIRRWAYKVVLWGNVLSQWSQLKGRSPKIQNWYNPWL